METFFHGFDVLLVAAGLLYLLYRYSTSTFSFWSDRKVPFLPPVPFFGNSLNRVFGVGSIVGDLQARYDFLGEHRFGGGYMFRRPTLTIKDPELVEQILIKDFSTFYNRSLNPATKLNPLSRNLLTLQNSQWKVLRSKLTPAFSSGRMKVLHQGLVDCCDHLVGHLSGYAQTGEALGVKKTMSRFVVYAIGSIAFGLKLDTLNDPECRFGKMGEAIFRTSFLGRLLGLLRMQYPSLAGHMERIVTKWRSWTGIGQDHRVFFMNVVRDTAEYREKNNVRRNDFLQIMMDLKKQDTDSEDEMKFDLELMSASAFVFLLAGYDTTAGAMSFMLYELAANQNVQERLLKEIQEVLKKYGGVPTYEAVKEMKYLDHVLSETLRLYPPIPSTFRVSRNPYQIPGTSVVIPAGMTVNIPIYCLQRDPKYFPDPERFDPDRFADESQIVKGTYLPFGDGPRICIAQKLATLEIKLAVIKLLVSYKFTVNEKTQTPFKYGANSFFLNPIGGLWLNVCRRNST